MADDQVSVKITADASGVAPSPLTRWRNKAASDNL